MKLTFNSGIVNPAFGFGNASFHIFMTLAKLGYDPRHNDLSREFQIAFTSPQVFHSFFSIRSKYRIGYFAWESFAPLQGNWIHELNFCDEVWVTNQSTHDAAREWGYEGPIKIFHHGINQEYVSTKQRHTNRLDVVNFGYPGVRKATTELFEWWGDSDYANSKDASLTIKVYDSAFERAKKDFAGLKNVNVVGMNFTTQENKKFMENFNLHVYPSYGEGFGLMPLETMASGMPTIVPRNGWCDYANIQPDLTFDSWRGVPDNPQMRKYHPGDMFVYDWNDVGDRIDYVANNLEKVTKEASLLGPGIGERFNWETLVSDQFSPYVPLLD